MRTFSERNGYVKIDDALVRESMPTSVRNAISNCYQHLKNTTNYNELNKVIWLYFLNQREADYSLYQDNIDYYLIDEHPWFKKLDLIEFILNYLKVIKEKNAHKTFTDDLNFEFARLNYAYRIIDGIVVEITNEEEIKSITTAIDENKDNIKMHLQSAITLMAKRPKGEYRNSIKESISAVEAYCREITGENTLGPALNNLIKKGIVIPNVLIEAFHKLYGYTCSKETGIRHSLMVDEGTYIPSYSEALFMLVSCSAFINYLNQKTII